MQLPLIGKVKHPLRWLVTSVAIAAIIVAAGGYAIVRKRSAQTDISDLTVPVEAKDLTVRITANGTVQPIESVNLSPKTAGRLKELRVSQGQRIGANAIVAIMEDEDQRAQYRQAKANVEQAQAQLEELKAGTRTEVISQAVATVQQRQAQISNAKARLNLALERVKRNQFLENEGAIARDALDAVLEEASSARANLDQAHASLREAKQRLRELNNGPRSQEIDRARAAVNEAKGRLEAAQVQLNDTIIRAPFAGIITQKYANVGAFVTPTTSASSTTSATSTSIVAIASGIEVLAEVPEVNIGQITPNQVVEVVADAYPDQVFKGQVRLIAPEAVVEQNVTSFQVRVRLLTGQQQLRSGMNVDLTFLGDELQNILAVPTVAIITKEGQTGVLIPNEKDEPVFQPVTIGPAIGNQIPIIDGAEAGDRVFIDLPKGLKLEDIEDASEL